ncbi:MAG: hypothetical protein PHS49_04315 [Candidatus Gracilibacteria bacterium]|nr:hypothetical protein [Candidatus Gracilibacteria bacterium]
MTPITAQANILDVLNFQEKTASKNNLKKEISKLKQEVIALFQKAEIGLSQIKKQLKNMILQSNLYNGAKQKIVKFLDKMK